jgi:hypothetical protein
MRLLLLSVLLAFAWPAAAQEKKADSKTVMKKAPAPKTGARKDENKKPEPKKAQTKKTVEPTQDWGRFNTSSKKDLEKIEKDKAAKKR